MAADLEIDALAAVADRVAGEARTRRARLLAVLKRSSRKADTIRSYRRLFLDDGGAMTPAAIAVFGDIATIAQLGRFDPGGISDADMRERNGARKLALHILSQLDLDGSRLRKLAKTMRETDGE
jgi:hypothetical protein